MFFSKTNWVFIHDNSKLLHFQSLKTVSLYTNLCNHDIKSYDCLYNCNFLCEKTHKFCLLLKFSPKWPLFYLLRILSCMTWLNLYVITTYCKFGIIKQLFFQKHKWRAIIWMFSFSHEEWKQCNCSLKKISNFSIINYYSIKNAKE